MKHPACIAAIGLLVMAGAASAQQDAAPPPQCSAFIARKQQNIRYTPRTDAEVLAELAPEIAYFKLRSEQHEAAQAQQRRFNLPVYPNTAEEVAAAGRRLEAAIRLGPGPHRASERAAYEKLRTAYLMDFRQTWIKNDAKLIAEMPEGLDTPDRRLSLTQRQAKAAILQGRAQYAYDDLIAAERVNRLKLDAMTPDAADRGAVERAYYDAIVAQMAALKTLEDAMLASARLRNVNMKGYAYDIKNLICPG